MTGSEMLVVSIAGVLVGALSAMFGVGGGVVMVPFIVLVLERTQHVAEGTSLLVIVPTAVVGVLMHRRKRYVSFRYAALLAGGGLGGAYLGAIFALNLSAATLQMIFGAFMAAVGARTVWRGLQDMRHERNGKRAEQSEGSHDLPLGTETG